MSAPPEKERRDLFVYLGEQLVAKAEQQPITITYVFCDGTRTFEIKPGEPLYMRLAARRSEALRSSLAKLRKTREDLMRGSIGKRTPRAVTRGASCEAIRETSYARRRVGQSESGGGSVSASSNGAGSLRQVLQHALDQSAMADSAASMADYTVLSPQKDPYRLDLPDNHRNGQWFAEVVARLVPGDGTVHLRGPPLPSRRRG